MSMMSGVGFNNPPVNNQGQLVRTQIQSPNYVPNTSGWTINKDGSAQFNNLTVTGGTTEQGTSLYYIGAPAAGNLFLSIANVGGTDSFGNTYVDGIGIYSAAGAPETVLGHWDNNGLSIDNNTGSGSMNVQNNPGGANFSPLLWFNSGAGLITGKTTAFRLSALTELGNTAEAGEIIGPTNTNDPNSSFVFCLFEAGSSTNADGARFEVFFSDTGGISIPLIVANNGMTGIGSMLAAKPGTTPTTGETWHTPSFQPNWSDANSHSAAFAPLAYRLMPDNTLLFRGGFFSGAAFVPPVQMGSVPAGYIPPFSHYVNGFEFTNAGAFTSASVEVASSGGIFVNSAAAVAAGCVIGMDGVRVPLI